MSIQKKKEQVSGPTSPNSMDLLAASAIGPLCSTESLRYAMDFCQQYLHNYGETQFSGDSECECEDCAAAGSSARQISSVAPVEAEQVFRMASQLLGKYFATEAQLRERRVTLRNIALDRVEEHFKDSGTMSLPEADTEYELSNATQDQDFACMIQIDEDDDGKPVISRAELNRAMSEGVQQEIDSRRQAGEHTLDLSQLREMAERIVTAASSGRARIVAPLIETNGEHTALLRKSMAAIDSLGDKGSQRSKGL